MPFTLVGYPHVMISGCIDPARPAVDPQDLAEQIQRDQVAHLARQLPTIMLVNVVTAGVTAVVLWPVTAHGLVLGWVAAIDLFVALRLYLWRRWMLRPQAGAASRQLTRVIASGILSGCLWGFGGFALLPPSALFEQIFFAFVIGGMAAGAVASMSFAPAACLGFILPSLLPLILRFLTQSVTMSQAMGLLLAVYMLALAALARNGYWMFHAGVRRKLEIEALTRSVAAEKERAESKSALLENILTNMSDGIVAVAPDLTLLACNERFRQLAELPVELCRIGTPIRSLLRHGASRADAKPERMESLLAILVADDAPPRERRQLAGRTVEIRRRRMPDGGSITLLSDVLDAVPPIPNAEEPLGGAALRETSIDPAS